MATLGKHSSSDHVSSSQSYPCLAIPAAYGPHSDAKRLDLFRRGNETDHSGEGEKAVKELKHIMETCMTLRVPIIADAEKGRSWGEVR